MVLRKKLSRKSWLIILVVLVVAVVAILEATNTTHFFHKAAKVSAPSKPLTKLPQSSKNNGNKNPSGGSTAGEGTAIDKNGQVPSGVSNDPSQWSTSTSRLITVKAPLRNSTFHSGDTVTGSTSVADQVQYRLVDDQAGVIAQGSISVVNGNFTATINFKPYGSSGSLDIFNTDQNGKELNEVQVPLNF